MNPISKKALTLIMALAAVSAATTGIAADQEKSKKKVPNDYAMVLEGSYSDRADEQKSAFRLQVQRRNGELEVVDFSLTLQPDARQAKLGVIPVSLTTENVLSIEWKKPETMEPFDPALPYLEYPGKYIIKLWGAHFNSVIISSGGPTAYGAIGSGSDGQSREIIDIDDGWRLEFPTNKDRWGWWGDVENPKVLKLANIHADKTSVQVIDPELFNPCLSVFM